MYADALPFVKLLPTATEDERVKKDNYLICSITGLLELNTSDDVRMAVDSWYFLSETDLKSQLKKRELYDGVLARVIIEHRLLD